MSALVLVAACAGPARLPVEAGIGPSPQLPPPEHALIPSIEVAKAKGWPAGMAPIPAPGLQVAAFAQGWTIRAGCTCCPTATCWWRRRTRRRNGRGRAKRHQGLCHEASSMRKAGAGGAERQSHHAAARRRRRRRCRSAQRCSSRTCDSPFGMALVGNDALRRQRRRARALPYRAGADAHHEGAPEKVADLPAGRSTTTGPRALVASRTAAALRRRSAPTATSARTAWRWSRAAPRSGRSIRETGAGQRLRQRPAQSDRHGLGAIERQRSGPWSTSATSSAAIWCPTT